jgi:hypothetical protein
MPEIIPASKKLKSTCSVTVLQGYKVTRLQGYSGHHRCILKSNKQLSLPCHLPRMIYSVQVLDIHGIELIVS